MEAGGPGFVQGGEDGDLETADAPGVDVVDFEAGDAGGEGFGVDRVELDDGEVFFPEVIGDDEAFGGAGEDFGGVGGVEPLEVEVVGDALAILEAF